MGKSKEVNIERLVKNRVIKYLKSVGKYDISKEYHIIMYAKEVKIYMDCMAEVEAAGVVSCFSNGKQEYEGISPHYKAAAIANKAARGYASDLGITPASEARIRITAKTEKKSDPVAKILNMRKQA